MSRIDSLAGALPPAADRRTNNIQDLDMNQFLKLMISELTNQDPLNPMDNTQLVQQLGSIREIAANDKLSSTLTALQIEQSLTTASSLIGKEVAALTTDNEDIRGVVDRVSVEVDPQKADKRTYRVHIGERQVELKNVREIK
ncbi:MAG TPA: flagellar hook capping FlgD N-terminal domain-containing protein [Pirellulaceae bacterium]|nr:flagellar hook capping FlgD N-terminal domain-containing protein [Pirellulaceae bacterium]